MKAGRRRLFSLGIALLAVLGLSLPPVPAEADPILDFGIIAPTPGTISYAGGVAPLVGTSIVVDSVVGLDTPLSPGVTLTCVSCTLSFTTGGLTGSTATTWEFGSGGTITVVGGVDLDGSGIGAGDIPLGTTLLAGSFFDATVTALAGGTFKITAAAFADTKEKALTDFYGLPDGTVVYTGGLNLSFSAAGSPPAAFTSTTVLSGDIANSPVPEPGSLLLLGFGLAGVGLGIRRRRMR